MAPCAVVDATVAMVVVVTVVVVVVMVVVVVVTVVVVVVGGGVQVTTLAVTGHSPLTSNDELKHVVVPSTRQS